ncbi:MAG: PilW family protein [Clostridia bacterium]|jgi:Tfp pilus assembly protein PilW|nr:hypothetical protein [Clostridiales bacterium]
MKRLHNSKGFSIAELLIALGLSSLVITIVFMVYFSGAKAWSRAENQVEVQQNLRVAMNTLSAEVRKADHFAIETGKRGIVLTYQDGSSKTYRFHPASGEIRMYPSGTTVAMHIMDCRFSYSNHLITIEITTKAIEGIGERDYTLSINARGKESDG